ncbi:MAG TPA: DUF2894 domain-containing protein [Paraburkholderia sp.]|jgi:hypothetical protein
MTGDGRDGSDGIDACDGSALLDVWRASGADRVDPVRFRMLDAFARRAARHEGDTRRILDARLATLIAAYAADVKRATAEGNAALQNDTAQPGALAALNDHIACSTVQQDATWPDLALLDYFKKTWSRLSTDIQLRQSREQVPTNAGPLNSSSLVHRALSLMREQSPAYLQHFLSYVDALSWMEQMNGGEAPAPKEARRAPAAKKGARNRSR